MHKPRPAEPLRLLADLALPSGTDIRVWADGGTAKLVRPGGGLRGLVFAAPGAHATVAVTDAGQQVGRLLSFRVSETGEVEDLGRTDVCPSAMEDAAVASFLGRTAEPVVVGARDLAAWVRDNGHAPDRIRGSRGALYAPLYAGPPLPEVAVRGAMPEGTPRHVLRFRAGEADEAPEYIFAPAPGMYLLSRNAEAALAEEDPCLKLSADGTSTPLGSIERMRLWSAQEPDMPIVEAIPPRARVEPEPAASQPEPVHVSAMPETPDHLLDAMVASYAQANEEAGTAPDEYMAEDFDRTDEPPVGEEPVLAAQAWRGLGDGVITPANWRSRGRPGEAWAAALLRCVAGANEIDGEHLRSAAHVALSGLPLSSTDADRLEAGLLRFKERLDAVRVLEGTACFAYTDGESVRVASADGAGGPALRAAAAKAFGVSARKCELVGGRSSQPRQEAPDDPTPPRRRRRSRL